MRSHRVRRVTRTFEIEGSAQDFTEQILQWQLSYNLSYVYTAIFQDSCPSRISPYSEIPDAYQTLE